MCTINSCGQKKLFEYNPKICIGCPTVANGLCQTCDQTAYGPDCSKVICDRGFDENGIAKDGCEEDYFLLGADKECVDIGEERLKDAATVGECADLCAEKAGCQVFLYGVGAHSMKNRCYWEKTNREGDCGNTQARSGWNLYAWQVTGVDYCESGEALENEAVCSASLCCRWNTEEGQCESNIGTAICNDIPTKSRPYVLEGQGVAGPEYWGVDVPDGAGPAACYSAVMSDPQCAKDYFSYVPRGDLNCGCKTTGDLAVRADPKADYYKISALLEEKSTGLLQLQPEPTEVKDVSKPLPPKNASKPLPLLRSFDMEMKNTSALA
jgi:hypothetical protein